MSALTASDIAAQEAVIIVDPDLMAMSALPLQVLWGEAHGSISIEEGQPIDFARFFLILLFDSVLHFVGHFVDSVPVLASIISCA